MTCSWTYEHYRSCIAKAREHGYALLPFKEVASYPETQPLIILRHDIDRSLSRALTMARMEKELGVRATYFVRVHAPTYNVFEYNTYRALQEIRSLGHEIGLHFEAVDFGHINGEAPLEVFQREKAVLETALNITVVSAAAHGEHSRSGPGHNRDFFQCFTKEQVGIKYDAYDTAFTREMKYISDSSGIWREGCMCNHIGKYPRLQILVHPCWWFKDHPFE